MTRINPNVTVSTSLPKGVDVVVVGLASINKGDAAAVGVPAETVPPREPRPAGDAYLTVE